MKVRKFLLPILSGLLLALTLPPFEIEILVWFALLPLFFFLNQTQSKKQIIIGSSLAGFIYILCLLWPLTSLNSWWIINPDQSSFWWQNKELLLKIFILFASIYCGSTFFAIFGLFYQKFKRNDWKDIVMFSFFWAILEFLREFFVFGFGWGELGYSLHNNLPMIQIASIVKVYGLSFIIVAVNISVFLLIKSLGEPENRKSGLKYSFFIFFLIAIPLIFGYQSLKIEKNGRDEVKIAVFHSNMTTIDSITKEGHEIYIEKIGKSLGNKPDFIVLPENSLPWIIIDEENGLNIGFSEKNRLDSVIFRELTELSNKNPDITILIGLHSTKNGNNFNSIMAFEAGKIVDIYHKRKILPVFEDNFGSFIKNHVDPIKKSENEEKSGLKNSKNVEITALLCSEISMNELAKSKNADFIINSGNDSVFDNSIVARQNEIMAKIRAVENKKFVVRSLKGGISSVISPNGEIIEKSKDKDLVEYFLVEIKI